MTATETAPFVTWTQYNNQWMLRSDEILTDRNTISVEVPTIGGGSTTARAIEVITKSGDVSERKIGEFEATFKNDDGTKSHIYSVRN
tara:strand:+ start:11854 stop:12114 length:261 start_codon:yes stop_codon:yes gene_type:complete